MTDTITVDEAAALIGVSRWTISRRVRRGDLTNHDPGGRIILDRAQVQELADRIHAGTPTTEPRSRSTA